MLKGSFAFFMSEKVSFYLPVASAEARFASSSFFKEEEKSAQPSVSKRPVKKEKKKKRADLAQR